MADANRLAAALRYQQDMEGPVTMNPNIAEQGRKGRANMAPPTSVMDPRSRDYERRSRETENFLIGADILAGALPFAPLAKGAAMAAGRYATPKVMQGMENYMGRTGMTLNAAPQDEALRLAQQRAALPISQHGLGLPAANTPEQRAAIMFPQNAYHGSGEPLMAVNNEKVVRNAYGKGLHSAADPKLANIFAGHSAEGQNIAPLRLNLGNQASKQDYKDVMNQVWEQQGHDATEIRKRLIDKGFDTVTYNHGDFNYPVDGKLNRSVPNQDLSFASLNPDNVRSRFAAFDPWRRNSALAAALGVAAPDLLAEEK